MHAFLLCLPFLINKTWKTGRKAFSSIHPGFKIIFFALEPGGDLWGKFGHQGSPGVTKSGGGGGGLVWITEV